MTLAVKAESLAKGPSLCSPRMRVYRVVKGSGLNLWTLCRLQNRTYFGLCLPISRSCISNQVCHPQTHLLPIAVRQHVFYLQGIWGFWRCRLEYAPGRTLFCSTTPYTMHTSADPPSQAKSEHTVHTYERVSCTICCRYGATTSLSSWSSSWSAYLATKQR